MQQISGPDALKPGDVLHHPAFGFATVEGLDASGATLRWELQGTGHPVHASPAALGASYRRCEPRGLFARSVRDPDGTRTFVQAEPLAALGLLLHELGGAASRDDVRDWMVSRRLFAESRFDAWWGAVVGLAEGDAHFAVRRDGVSLGGGVGPEDLARPRPLPAPGTLPGSAALRFAVALARQLAAVHAMGDGVVPSRDAVQLVGDGVRFRTRGAPTANGRRDDVRFVLRLVLEQVVGPLPSPAHVAEGDLPTLIGALAPSLPPELLAVAIEAMGEDAAHRPADGLALLERLSVADAVVALRGSVGHAPQAQAVAGFNTHIGLLKSLQSQTNQDAFLLVGDPNLSLLAVFDGISQSTAGTGDLASGLATRALRTWWAEHGDELASATPAKIHAALDAALERANALVCDAALRLAGGDLERNVPMGTTAVCAVTRGNRVHLAALGDSRAYLVGRHGAAPLLSDQNVLALRVRDVAAGLSVEWSGADHALVGYLGHFEEDGRVSLPPVFHRTVDLLPGEWLVVCSDGLTDYAAPGEGGVARALAQACTESKAPTPAATAMEVCRRLVDAANRGGGGDNVTVLALTLSSEYGPAGSPSPVSS